MIHTVADRPTGDRTNGTPNESAAEGVAAAGVVADNRTSERADGASGDGALLGVRPSAGAAGEQRG